MVELTIQPDPAQWLHLIQQTPHGQFADRSLAAWRDCTRAELNLDRGRPIVATGHQALLWHPGILAKYFAAEAFAETHNFALANLVVDQHVGEFGSFDVPVRLSDGSLGVQRIDMCIPRDEVPMSHHQAFDPLPTKIASPVLTDAVATGVQRIIQAVRSHRFASNAAWQMAGAIADLMESPAFAQAPNITATALIQTTLAQEMMRIMVADPQRCAACYNRAVASVPEAGIGSLMMEGDDIELPLWRMADDGRRVRAHAHDVQQAVIEPTRSDAPASRSKIELLPRALFMTALVRMGMCDLFIHGTGGAAYDRAMEVWIRDWLGIEVGSFAVVSATVRLPMLANDGDDVKGVHAAMRHYRGLWHDPERLNHRAPSEAKRKLLEPINSLPRNSAARRARYLEMHEHLQSGRLERAMELESARADIALARQMEHDREIATRRDWAFPLYPAEVLAELKRRITQAFHQPTAAHLFR